MSFHRDCCTNKHVRHSRSAASLCRNVLLMKRLSHKVQEQLMMKSARKQSSSRHGTLKAGGERVRERKEAHITAWENMPVKGGTQVDFKRRLQGRVKLDCRRDLSLSWSLRLEA